MLDRYDDLGPLALLADDPEAIAAAEAADAAERAAAEQATAARKAARAAQLRPSSRQLGERRYAGVIRRGAAIVAECGHEHTNREWSTRTGGTGATDCARSILAGAANPHTAEHTADRLRRGWESLASNTGHIYPASVIEAAKTTAAAAADSYLAAVATVRTLTD